MTDYLIGNTKLPLRAADVVGKGGEADIYVKGGQAFKIFKTPRHPDFTGSPADQQAAAHRIKEHQTKLPAFPNGLPARVVVPEELVRDGSGGIAGYRMRFLSDAEVLYRYGERSFREQGVSDETAVAVLADLHRTVDGVHHAGVVIGDFNDLNVLVRDREAYLIDADSMQYGPYRTHVFTTKFVDPLVCDPRASCPVMMKPHTAESDWYAYLVMLMQTLLFVGPFGGVHKPVDPTKRVSPDARALKRLTVFDPEVVYPKPARPYGILPDELLDLFERTFAKDARGMPPLPIIEGLRFSTCASCGAVHARRVCPSCTHVTKAMEKEVHTGSVQATKVLSIDGRLLYATLQDGVLRYLYHEHGAYKREGGRMVLTAPLDPNARVRIRGKDTIFARGNQAVALDASGTQTSLTVEAHGLLPLLDANGSRLFFAYNGELMRTGDLGYEYPERVASVLPNQTLFWVGDTLGFGFYRAAELSNFFVLRTAYRGINDSVELPAIRGQLIDATCCFSDTHIWFFTCTKEGQRTYNRCFLLSADGKLLGAAEAAPGDGSWLGTLRGKFAFGARLLASTDDGVMRIAEDRGALVVEKEYPDTKRFVEADSQLFLTKEGLLVVGRHDIWRLVLGAP